MNQKSMNPIEKKILLEFLESYYDIPRHRLDNSLKKEYFRTEIEELDFIEKRSLSQKEDSDSKLSDEFYSRTKYICELVNLNMKNPPRSRDGYIKQIDITDDGRRKVKENPQIVTKRITSDKSYNKLLNRIENQIEFLNEELSNCKVSENLRRQVRLILSFITYCIRNGSSADIQNSIRPIKYLSAKRKVSKNRVERTYAKTAKKLETVFDQKKEIADNLYPYYEENLEDLVYAIDRCYETLD
jgi:hypothetical protein